MLDQQAIFKPMAAMFALTALVWAYMYTRRLHYILSNRIDPQRLATPEAMQAAIPPHIHNASNNLRNLFELPVIFYATCLVIYLMQAVDMLHFYLAWAFVVLRGVHSLVHCSVNLVSFRFTAYMLASICLWVMVVRVVLLSI
jgi:hypothetical protein